MNNQDKNNLSFSEKLILGCQALLNDESQKNHIDIAELKNEILFESILLEKNVISPTVSLDDDSLWVEMISSVVSNKPAEDLFTDDQWALLIRNAIDHSQKKNDDNKRVFFPVLSRISIAALFVLFLLGCFVFYSFRHKPTEFMNVSQGIDSTETIKQNHMSTSTKPVNSVVKTDIVLLDSGSTATTEYGTKLNDIKIADKRVSLTIESGTALFSVAKKRQRKFTVQSRFADVIVIGTVFRVTEKNDYTLVNVIEGSVIVKHKLKEKEAVLGIGQISFLDMDTLVVIEPDSLNMVPERNLIDNIVNSYQHGISDKKSNQTGGSGALSNRPTSGSAFTNLQNNFDNTNSKEIVLFDMYKLFELRKDYGSALRIMELISKKSGKDPKLFLQKALLNLESGDTSKALEQFITFKNCSSNDTDKCIVNRKMYNIYMKMKMLDYADKCVDEMISTGSTGATDMELLVYEHANALRNVGNYDRALYWYEFIIDKYPNSLFRIDAEYGISYCTVQNGIFKQSARKFSDTNGL